MRYNLLYIVPQTILVDSRWNFERNFIVWNMQIWRNWQTRTVQQMISANRNCSYRAIALGKSVAADLLRFADKSAHQVRSCSSDRTFIVCKIKNNISLCRYGEIGRRARFRSVCFITCEFESRYLHQVKLRMKSSWLFNFAKFERAVPPGPKRHSNRCGLYCMTGMP